MFPETGNHTILIFRQIQFYGDWSRGFPPNDHRYTPEKKAYVLVLADWLPGITATYVFVLDAGQEVVTTYGENQMHLPGHCLGVLRGNYLRCKTGLRASLDAIKKNKGNALECDGCEDK